MSYELVQRKHDDEYWKGPQMRTSAAWPGSGDGDGGYMSMPSPYEFQYQSQSQSQSQNQNQSQGQRQDHGMLSPESGYNEFQYFEPVEAGAHPSSSTTHILGEGNDSSVLRHRGLRGHDQNGKRGLVGVVGDPWQPGFWRRFPWLGVLSLLLTVAFTLACVVVLRKAQGQPIDQWGGRFQPTVYLSIFTAGANIALTYALYQGLVISFWYKAGEGATLQELHQYWQSGSSLWAAFFNIMQLRSKVVGFACIMTVLSIGRGPLMQRSSLVQNVIVGHNGTLSIFSAVELPFGYAGIDTGRTSTPSMMNPNFTDVYEAYTNKSDIAGVWSGCNATCYAQVKGIGFGVSCNKTQIEYFLDPIQDGNSTLIRNQTQVFTVVADQIETYEPGSNYYNNQALFLNATFMDTPTEAWNGTMLSHTCALSAGIVSYAIKIVNNTLTLANSSWQADDYLETIGLDTLPYNEISNSAGFILAANNLYQGSALFQFGGGAGWILNLQGASANRYLQRSSPSSNYYYLDSNITWRDPMDDMINSMREIAFRTSLRIAADNTSYPNASQRVPFQGSRPQTVYTTEPTFLASAVALSLLGALAVLPTYRGFWALGRTVSLSPLEVAKAFHAPLLGSAQGNRSAEEMLDELGWTRVRYGDSGPVFTATTAHNQGPPGAFGNVYGREEVVRRLGIGRVEEVRPPEKGGRYV